MAYVYPKTDCSHVHEVKIKLPKKILSLKCSECGENENWMCLYCGDILCSRYKNSHMAKHYESSKHPIAMSFSDLSFWCYECNDYIVDKSLKGLYHYIHKEKFGLKPGDVDEKYTSYKKSTKDLDKTEYFDKEEVIDQKVKEVAEIFKKVNRVVVYTGAGISVSAGVPDYRGPKGVWTLLEKGEKVTQKFKMKDIMPTYAHDSIAVLLKKGLIHYVISTNIDGLHVKSGVPRDRISELHGNVFVEFCKKCETQYYRDRDVTKSDDGEIRYTNSKHGTGRKCEKKDCDGDLEDNIVHFNEPLPGGELLSSIENSYLSELSLVLGTSLLVQPACSFPFYSKKKGGKVVIVNLQKTLYDDETDVRIFCPVDHFMKKLMKALKIE